MTRGNGKMADEGREGRIEHIACDLSAANRVGTIAGDYFLPKLLRRAHAVRQSVGKCVDATADVLQIEDDHVDVAQHLFGWFARLAVKGKDRQPGFSVSRVRGLDHIVLDITADSVFRTEDRGLIAITMFMKDYY